MSDHDIATILIVFSLVAIVISLLTRLAIGYGYPLSSPRQMMKTLTGLTSVKKT
jgi:hypothetical protein